MLDHIALPGFEDGRGVHLPMMDGDMPARVFVARVALQGEGAPLGECQYMARFKESPGVYQAVTRGKFEPGSS